MSLSPEEREEYLQIYLDETEEELDALVETMLVLEENPKSTEHLNEAFRMVHSMKGAAGMMGFTEITSVTHLLESRFEKLRSGHLLLDRPTMAVTLRCVDYLRNCSDKLRNDAPFDAPNELLSQLESLEAAAHKPSEPEPDLVEANPMEESSEAEKAPALKQPTAEAANFRVEVLFEPGLKLLDMKGQLVLARVGELGRVVAMRPTIEELAIATGPVKFEIMLASDSKREAIEAAADVHGADKVTVVSADGKIENETNHTAEAVDDAESPETTESAASPEKVAEPKKKVAETVRVDIDRLDNLLNLAGELVVNKARFAQIATRMSPSFKRNGDANRGRSFVEGLSSLLQGVRAITETNGDDQLQAQLNELQEEMHGFEDHWEKWEQSRRCFAQITEAIDQLSRVSDSLQRGVLQTRMVSVAPLFNRFKRVVRDLSVERDKKTNLQISGEKTELDKRMIDELGDPLVHLVRNSIDHGMESPEARVKAGKAETGTIRLEASHSGNNVFIRVIDDGGGIDASKIRSRIVERGLLSENLAKDLSDEQAIDYIWNPGFSTAAQVTNISGRGVGMDIVKTRIAELNGTIEVESRLGEGATFTIRLPLTLAIISSLLFRIRDIVFSVPIDDVREIVSLTPKEIVSIHGKQTFSVRGRYLPLVEVDDLFEWNGVNYKDDQPNPPDENVNVVVLQSVGKAVGLRVDELLGGEDIVIKSLSENFVNIRGLSGASILGDGSVSLLLDVGTVQDMAVSNEARVVGAQS